MSDKMQDHHGKGTRAVLDEAGPLRAWCVNLLSVIAHAYPAGRVAVLDGEPHPQVALLPQEDDAPALVTALVFGRNTWKARSGFRQLAQGRGDHELWLLNAFSGEHELYQRSAAGKLERVPPDANGIYFSAANEELHFPVAWFTELPSLWGMMAHWAMIDGD